MSHIVEVDCNGFGIHKFNRLDTNLNKLLRRQFYVYVLIIFVDLLCALYLVDATFLIGLIQLRCQYLIEAQSRRGIRCLLVFFLYVLFNATNLVNFQRLKKLVSKHALSLCCTLIL